MGDIKLHHLSSTQANQLYITIESIFKASTLTFDHLNKFQTGIKTGTIPKHFSTVMAQLE